MHCKSLLNSIWCSKPAVLKTIYISKVKLNGKTLELLITREKYLGFFVSDSFYSDDYISNQIGNTYARGNTIIRHFKHCSDVKVKFYNSYCCSIYCCALFSVYHKTVLDKLQLACNKVLKFDGSS